MYTYISACFGMNYIHGMKVKFINGQFLKKLYGTAKQSKSKCCLFFVYMHSMHIFHCIVWCMTGFC